MAVDGASAEFHHTSLSHFTIHLRSSGLESHLNKLCFSDKL